MTQDEAEKLARKFFVDNGIGFDGAQLVKLVSFIREIEGAAWKPISEAPKDGTDVELWLEHGLTAVPGYFISREYLEREYGDPEYMEEGWYPSCKFEFDLPEVTLNPTHFRFIQLPAQKENGE